MRDLILQLSKSSIYSTKPRTLPNYDCCLLGPQIKYKFEEFNKKAAAVGKRVAVIDSMDYGMMRGDKILAAALALLDEPSLNK
ncbi:hypothetical protein QIG51_25755 [Klebsiella pneumoniae]|nr:hypothetical protein [Klebsiella pneumoniae]